jgi:hypothetical protein
VTISSIVIALRGRLHECRGVHPGLRVSDRVTEEGAATSGKRIPCPTSMLSHTPPITAPTEESLIVQRQHGVREDDLREEHRPRCFHGDGRRGFEVLGLASYQKKECPNPPSSTRTGP